MEMWHKLNDSYLTTSHIIEVHYKEISKTFCVDIFKMAKKYQTCVSCFVYK